MLTGEHLRGSARLVVAAAVAVDISGSLCVSIKPDPPAIIAVCAVAGQDLISGRVISRKLGDLPKRLVWGFKTTTGDGMI